MKKSVVKQLSRDEKTLPLNMTPQIAGGDSYTEYQTEQKKPEPITSSGFKRITSGIF